jgi:hypothetical protein
MSGTTLRILITLVLLVHGVGHVMGAMPALGLFDDERRSGQGWLKNWSSHSWLLTDLLGYTVARTTGGERWPSLRPGSRCSPSRSIGTPSSCSSRTRWAP